jgi:glycosyltransferase involved in cell wall biosynthesis
MNEIKGHVDLLAAARAVYQKDPRIRFVIGGKQDQSYFRLLQEQVAENHLTEIAAFSGWQDDMTGFYRGLDIFVFPSRCDEAFGLVSAEAMATGLPVISTRSGGASEVVENGKTGILVERQCPDQLADAIECLAISAATRICMGRAGRERAETLFDLSKQASQLHMTLETVANSASES